MPTIGAYLATYAAVLAALLIVAYLIPAGIFHWLIIYSRYSPSIVAGRIQARRHRPDDVGREVKASIISLALFSAYSVVLLAAHDRGLTAVYWNVSDYPIWWIPVSFLLTMVLHDSYFYWTHRLMHTRALFRHFHSGHHRSLTPTPWAILSFQPLETLFQFGFFALLILLIPMHPGVLLAYLLFDGIVNAAGHCGHEIVPDRFRDHALLKYANAVTHHDIHHSRFNYNFGQYLNVWDRLMGTFLDRPPEGGALRVDPTGTVSTKSKVGEKRLDAGEVC